VDQQIVVKGSAQVRVTPDRALLHVTADGEAAGRDDAYRAASQVAQAVDDVLAAHEAGIERTTTTALVVQPRTRWHKGESKRTGWIALRRSTVEVTSFERLGDLFAELANAGATVVGPSWVVDDDNEAHRTVRRDAAADARRRADDYVQGLGIGAGDVVAVNEPGLRTETFAAAELSFAPQARAAGGAYEEVIDVQPEDVVIAAAVEVTFALVPAPG
jgi:uncharacterized protein YggE